MITSDRSCLPEVTAGDALMVNPDDITALGAALEVGLTDAQWRDQAIVDGLLLVSQYDWGECVKQTAAVYVEAAHN